MRQRVIYLKNPRCVQPAYSFSNGTLSLEGREICLVADSGEALPIKNPRALSWFHLGLHGSLLRLDYEEGFLFLAVVWFAFQGKSFYHPLRMRRLKRALARCLGAS